MSMSILGGIAKGAPLAAPQSKGVRPTSVLLKRKFFDSHQSMQSVHFFDICAGSGSIGLEALSRGAELVTFVEAGSQTLRTAQKNYQGLLKKYEFPGQALFVKSDCVKWVEKFHGGDGRQNIFFFDPPYEKLDLYKKFIEVFKGTQKGRGMLVLEFCRQKTAPEERIQEWLGKPDKSYRQGTSFLYIYRFS